MPALMYRGMGGTGMCTAYSRGLPVLAVVQTPERSNSDWNLNTAGRKATAR